MTPVGVYGYVCSLSTAPKAMCVHTCVRLHVCAPFVLCLLELQEGHRESFLSGQNGLRPNARTRMQEK